MSELIQMIYSSAAKVAFSRSDLHELLDISRANNQRNNVTGMLLYDQCSFFQVLEGDAADVEALYAVIEQDKRHDNIVTIIKEPIFKRSFGEWTMGYADVSTEDISRVIGMSNFFSEGTTFGGVGPGRAKKLLNAFCEGRWRSRVNNDNLPIAQPWADMKEHNSGTETIENVYQPVFAAHDSSVLAYEVLSKSTSDNSILSDDKLAILLGTSEFAEAYYTRQIKQLAAHDTDLHYSLNFFGTDARGSKALLEKIIAEIKNAGMSPEQFIFEIHQSQMLGSPEEFGSIIREYKSVGLRFVIDHFGAGKAGLNLLEPYHPDMIALNQFMVADVHSNGPRQAIVRGVIQTCTDLGIEVVAKFITDADEYQWLKDAGVDFFQGDLFGPCDS